MDRIEVNSLIMALTGLDIELKEVNDTLYIKFDHLPFKVREFVHSQKDYDHSKMMVFERDCGCGHAAFLEAQLFYNLMSKYKA